MRSTWCEGLMLMERFFDYRDDTGEIEFTGWRCIICGEILDAVIAGNRKFQTVKEAEPATDLLREYCQMGKRLGTIHIPVNRSTIHRPDEGFPRTFHVEVDCTMNSRTLALIVPAPKAEVFRYLSKIESLPQWATEFCHELRVRNGKPKVLTCPAMGSQELFVEIRSDESTGVIDFLVGPRENQMAVFPARVVELTGMSTLLLFTVLQVPDTTDEQFEAQVQSLKREFENIKRQFMNW